MDFLETIIKQKHKEVAKLPLEEVEMDVKTRPSFFQALSENPSKVHVIAEVKRASPSKGVINEEVDIIKQAKLYEKAGVSAISVLTDKEFFKGNLADLKQISQEVAIPLLCKDFIISKKQLIRAKNAGASIVLLIVAALTKQALTDLYQEATDLGLEVLVETHNKEELKVAEALGAKIIGVNNRNLKTFDVTIETSIELAPHKEGVVYISESGFKEKKDVERIAPHFNAVLVGETLMRSSDVLTKAKKLQVKRP